MSKALKTPFVQISICNRKLFKTFLKNIKKGVDKASEVAYNNEAVAESGGGTLKTS